MPQWLAREYLARRGGAWFTPDQVISARCPLLGFALRAITVEGQIISPWFLQTETQPEIGEAVYDQGASMLADFFREQLMLFLDDDLLPLGRSIIEHCLAGAPVEAYIPLMDSIPLFRED